MTREELEGQTIEVTSLYTGGLEGKLADGTPVSISANWYEDYGGTVAELEVYVAGKMLKWHA